MRAAFFMAGIGLALGLYLFATPPQSPAESGLRLTLGSATIRADLATTSAARSQGLSGRAGLAEDEGLLFVFVRDGQYSFWMKDMRFPIDIIWIAADKRIVEVASEVAPETYPHSFTSRELARFVLEVPAGFAAAHGITVGSYARGIPSGLAAE